MSYNARGICEVAGRKRSEAEFSDGHFAYPELCDVARPRAAGRAASATRACPRALCKSASTGALAEGGAILHNVTSIRSCEAIWVEIFVKSRNQILVVS